MKCKKVSETREPFQDLSLPIPGTVCWHHTVGTKVTTLAPTGRKEIAKFNSKVEGDGVDGVDGGDKDVSHISRGLCSVWNYVSTLTRDLLVGPPTDLDNCVNAFFDTSDLKGGYCQHWWAWPSTDGRVDLHFCVLVSGDNRYYCTHCRR